MDIPQCFGTMDTIAPYGKIEGIYSDAMRLTEKFLRLVDNVFSDTGKLWEKYNVIEGNINVTNEYEMPEMMGWTAGVYRAL